jgi:hypothetical protein
MSRLLARVKTWYQHHLRASRIAHNDDLYSGDYHHIPQELIDALRAIEAELRSEISKQFYNYSRM